MAPLAPPLVRARALRATLAMTDCLWDLPQDEALRLAGVHLKADDLAAMALADSDDDLALANVCLQLEDELRRAEFAAVERLLALVTEQEGLLKDRLRDLPLLQFAQAVSCLIDAGWIDRDS